MFFFFASYNEKKTICGAVSMKRFFSGLILSLLLLYLFSHPSDGFLAAQSGLDLWFHTLIPTLLPTMIFSNLLIQLDLVQGLVRVAAPVTARLFRLSACGTYALVIGFLCGFPMGAKTVSDLFRSGRLSREEASYLLPFVNNISPMFLINVVIMQTMRRTSFLLPTLLIVYGSPLIYGILANQAFRRRLSGAEYKKQTSKIQIRFELIDACIMNAVFTVLKMGSYVILFSILSHILQTVPIPSRFVQSLLVGSMELTNGISFVGTQALPFRQTYFLLCILSVWGGLCALAQTKSVVASDLVPFGSYLKARIVICLIACLLAACFLL